MKRDKKCEKAFQSAVKFAVDNRLEFMTPELLLFYILGQEEGQKILMSYQTKIKALMKDFGNALRKVDVVPEEVGDYELLASDQMIQVLEWSELNAKGAGRKKIEIPHIIAAILELEESTARYLLLKHTTTDTTELMSTVIAIYGGEQASTHVRNEEKTGVAQGDESWKKLVTCVNDAIKSHGH